jgi:hypothetical protein
MRQFAFTVLPLFILILAFSCFDKESPNHLVEVRFQLLNDSGEPATSFREGRDILFDYRIINQLDESVTWYFDNIFNYHQMFTVYKIIPPSSEIPRGRIVEIGTPHTPKIMRDFRLGRYLPAKGEMAIRMSWKGDIEKTYMFDNWQIFYHERDLLTPGKYFVEFEQGFTFALYDAFHGRFRIDFEVK